MTHVRLPQWVAIGVTLAMAIAMAWIGTPRSPQLTDQTSGDAALADQLRTLASDSGHQALAAAVITPDAVTYAAVGETAPGSGATIHPGDPVAAGSIVKTFDGFLLADAEDRGEVGLDDPVGMHLSELRGTPLGDVTLTELASHRGGVPSLTPSVAWRAIPLRLSGANPYRAATRDTVLQEIRDLEPAPSRGTFQYSNLGATLLGWALAEAAGQDDWEAYVRQRLLDPLGVPATFAADPEELPPAAVPGFTTNGFEPEPWKGTGFQPAGIGAYVSSSAMSRYAQAIIRGDVPGAEAMAPRFDAGGATQIGLAWFTTSGPDGHQLTWHNGRTNAFSTMLVIDRTANRAVFVAGNTDERVEAIGFALLTGEPAPPTPFSPLSLIIPALAAFFVAMWLWSAFRAQNRVAIVSGFAGIVALLALIRPLGSWVETTPFIWAGLVLIAAGAAVAAAVRWPGLAWQADRFRAPRVAATVLNILIAGAAIALTATTR